MFKEKVNLMTNRRNCKRYSFGDDFDQARLESNFEEGDFFFFFFFCGYINIQYNLLICCIVEGRKGRTEVVSWSIKRQNRVAESGDERNCNPVSPACHYLLLTQSHTHTRLTRTTTLNGLLLPLTDTCLSRTFSS